jgi:hypothetical protein
LGESDCYSIYYNQLHEDESIKILNQAAAIALCVDYFCDKQKAIETLKINEK